MAMSSTLVVSSPTVPTTSQTPAVADDETGVDDNRKIMLWCVYVLLTVVLFCMTVASFVHYHLNNRHKYAEKKALMVDLAEEPALAPAPAPVSNDKYRVTLCRNGAVPPLVTATNQRSSPSLSTTKTSGPSGRHHNSECRPHSPQYQTKIQVQETPLFQPITQQPPSGYVSQSNDLSRPPADAYSPRPSFYVNEGYDRDASMCNSDRGLLNRSSVSSPLDQRGNSYYPPESEYCNESVYKDHRNHRDHKDHRNHKDHKDRRSSSQKKSSVPYSSHCNTDALAQGPRHHQSSQLLDHSWPVQSDRHKLSGKRRSSHQNMMVPPLQDRRHVNNIPTPPEEDRMSPIESGALHRS